MHFASDNYASAHPEVLAALAAANTGHAPAYGDDPWTARLAGAVRAHFGDRATVYPVLNGTGANVVSLTAMLPRWGAAIVTEHAHVNTDENGAPERVSGIKLLPHTAPDAKLTTAAIDAHLADLGDPHRAQPLVVSLTQSTELGTLYTPDEIATITAHAHAHGLRVHLDGARLANAAAALGTTLRALTTDVGVDVLSFGGTKNGLLLGEAVVVLDPSAVDGVEHVRKMTMQLASKMRYVSAQLLTLLGDEPAEDNLWRRGAAHANAMAARLRAALEDLALPGPATPDLATPGPAAPALCVPDDGASPRAPRLAFTQPTRVNAVFAVLPRAAAERVRETSRFYDWGPASADVAARLGSDPRELVEVRWMCSWDTTEADVDAFAAAVRTALG